MSLAGSPHKDTEQPLERFLVAVAVAIPAMLALGLAFIYAAGAISTAARMSHAEIPIRDGLVYVPLDQVLARGVPITLVVSAGTALTLPILLGALWLGPRLFPDSSVVVPDTSKAHDADPLLLKLTVIVLGVLFLAIMYLTAPPIAAAAFLAAVVGGAVLVHASRYAVAILYIYALFAVAMISLSWTDPVPLPRITLASTSGKIHEGVLVADTGATYYVTTGNEQILAIDHDRVTRAVLEPSTDVEDRTSTSDYVVQFLEWLF